MTESGNIEKWHKEKSLLKQSDAGSRIRQHFIANKKKRNHSSQGSKQGCNKGYNESYGFTFERVNLSHDRNNRMFISDTKDPFRYKKPKETFD